MDALNFIKHLMEFDILVSIHGTTAQISNVLKRDNLHRKAVVVFIDDKDLNTTHHVLKQVATFIHALCIESVTS